jgi:hypothetical protein
VTFHSLRKLFTTGVASLATAALLVSCGGGGSADTVQTGGFLRMNPQEATIFAGQPFVLTVTGGQLPYTLSSSEPSLLPVPLQMNTNSVTLIAANPGVVDANLQPGELPARTTKIAVRAANGQVLEGTYKVAQNFLFGYSVKIAPTTCPSGTGTTIVQACAGGESLVQFAATTNGNLSGGRQFRLEVLKGPFQWLFPDKTVAGNSVTVQSDHTGIASAILKVTNGADKQIAVFRIYDIPTGAYTDVAFVIQAAVAGALTVIPEKFTFTGALTTECGTGQGDFFVFDGKAPYTVGNSDPNVYATPTTSTDNPGKFTIHAVNPGVCVTGATIVVVDSLGNRGVVTVDTAKGDQTLPDLAVSPTALTLACGTSGSATVVGGRGSYFTSSTHPRVTAAVSGNTVTVTRPIGDGAVVYPTTATVNVSDGTKIVAITVTVPANCP